MKLSTALKENGLILPRGATAPANYELDCPKPYCKENRAEMRDEDPCLHLEVISAQYAQWKCRHCLWTDHIGEDPRITPAVPEPVAQLPASAPKEGLPPEIHEYFDALQIPAAIVEKNGIQWRADLNSIGFPYRDHNGDTTNMLLLQLPDQTTRLASHKRITFSGLDKARPHYDIIIVQGDLERMMLEALGFENVIGVPNGGNTPNGVRSEYVDEDDYQYLALAADLLLSAPKVTIATDNTPGGDRIRHEIARRLGAAKCFSPKFGKETLRKTYREAGMDSLCADINEAKAHPIRGLYEVQDFKSQLLTYFRVGMGLGVSTGFKNLDRNEKCWITIATKRLTIVTGMPNTGKSELVDAITLNLSEQYGWKHGVFSPENGKEVHVTKLVEKRVMQSTDPAHSRRMTEETFLAGSDWVNEHYFFIFSDSLTEKPTIEWILERAADAVLRYGIKNLIIDPWNRITKSPTASERDYIAQALDSILRFAHNYDVHVFLVVHPTKQEPDKKTGKFAVPSLYACSGSADFVNMTDNGIVVHRKEGADNATEVHVKKVRFKHEGKPGVAVLLYNEETGRYTPREEDESPTYSPYGHEEDETGPVKTWEPK